MSKNSSHKTKRARCKHVLAVLDNTLHTLRLLREDTYPVYNDDNATFAVVYYEGAGSFNEVMVPIESVVFLQD
jgi:hypothetical protein